MKNVKWKENFLWTVFVSGVIVLACSILCNATDMAAVCAIPILYSFALFGYNCWMDIKIAREVTAYKDSLRSAGQRKVARDCDFLGALDGEG